MQRVNDRLSLSEKVTVPDPNPGTAGSPYYKGRTGQLYGYVSFVSADEIAAGKSPVPFFYAYLGQSDGVYSIRTSLGDFAAISSCSDPCTTIKVVGTMGGVPVGNHTISFDMRTVVGRAMADAIAGRLTVYDASAPDASNDGAQAQDRGAGPAG